jgi:hypothetical protein
MESEFKKLIHVTLRTTDSQPVFDDDERKRWGRRRKRRKKWPNFYFYKGGYAPKEGAKPFSFFTK